MFDGVVRAGLSPQDSAMVEVASEYARQLADVTEAAIAEGDLSRADLFDQNYREIEEAIRLAIRQG